MKKLLLVALSAFAFARTYMTLDNGKTILLNDDGTWQEVKIIKKDGKMIALKKDGTWEEVSPKSVESANLLDNSVDKRYKDEPLVRVLLGRWASDDGSEYLTFTKDRAIFKLRQKNGFKTISGKWLVEKVDKDKKIVTVNIGEGARLGFLTFGGVIRKFKIIDSNTIQDITDQIETMKVYTLHKR